MGYDAQLTGQQTSKMTYQPRKLGQTDLFLVCDQSSPWSALAVLHVFYKRVPYSQRYLTLTLTLTIMLTLLTLPLSATMNKVPTRL